MSNSITLEQWKGLDMSHKVYAITMLNRRHFMPLLTVKELKKLLNTEESDLDKLYNKYKKSKLYWADGKEFKLTKPKNV